MEKLRPGKGIEAAHVEAGMYTNVNEFIHVASSAWLLPDSMASLAELRRELEQIADSLGATDIPAAPEDAQQLEQMLRDAGCSQEQIEAALTADMDDGWSADGASIVRDAWHSLLHQNSSLSLDTHSSILARTHDIKQQLGCGTPGSPAGGGARTTFASVNNHDEHGIDWSAEPSADGQYVNIHISLSERRQSVHEVEALYSDAAISIRATKNAKYTLIELPRLVDASNREVWLCENGWALHVMLPTQSEEDDESAETNKGDGEASHDDDEPASHSSLQNELSGVDRPDTDDTEGELSCAQAKDEGDGDVEEGG